MDYKSKEITENFISVTYERRPTPLDYEEWLIKGWVLHPSGIQFNIANNVGYYDMIFARLVPVIRELNTYEVTEKERVERPAKTKSLDPNPSPITDPDALAEDEKTYRVARRILAEINAEKGLTKKTMGFDNVPVLGQDALANGDLGIVVDYRDNFPHQTVTVKMKSTGVSHDFDAYNVTLIEPGSGLRKRVKE